MKHTMLHMKLNSAVSVFAVAAAFSVLLPSSAYCGICFLPDCGDDILAGGGDINMNTNSDTEWCEKKGYTYYASGKCPQYYAQIGKCSRDDYYLKCDAVTWCKQNAYNTQTCSIPNYVDTQCPNGQPYYKQCKRDNQRACRDTGYTNSCPSGQKLYQNSGRCIYDASYGTCCKPSGCPSYSSLSYSSYGTNGTDGCEYTCYYTCNMNCPSSYPYSYDPTGCSSRSTNGCGNKSCYNYQSCCSPYSNETGCSCGAYSCSDGCGGTRKCCSSCPEPEPEPTPPSCSHSAHKSCDYGCASYCPCCSACKTCNSAPSSGEGGGDSTPSTPSCNDTCSSKGYYSSKPAGMNCSTKTVCGNTCYTSCTSSHTHSYSCPSGSQSSSCGTGYRQTTVSKTCSCGATSGSCYKCEKCDSSYNLSYSQAYTEPAEYYECGGLYKRGSCYPEAYLSGGTCVYDCRQYNSCMSSGGSCDSCRQYSNAPECERNSGCY